MATNSSYPTGNGQPGSSELNKGAEAHAAVNLIRQKIARLYDDEPDAAKELSEAENAPRRSKHQQFMHQLSASGKGLAAIQTEWHNYYQGLTDTEKHEVWREFYASQPLLTGQPRHGSAAEAQLLARHKHEAVKPRASRKLRDARSATEIQASIRHKVSAGGRLQAKHHLQSILFGLGMGFVVLLIFLFGFFNEVVIAPFIQPSRASGEAPLIISSNSVATTSAPEVIIPKINVQIPVIYTETSTDENAIENDLQDGVVHYPTTVLPGQVGNAAFFGHSSNNIFNSGKYKFAFVLLHNLVPGDTFYLSYNSTMYVYKVISRNIVEPNQVGVLGPVPGQKATATLITCDPPGTSLHRLIVVGQQITPDPTSNAAPVSTAPIQPASLPGNGPTLWTRFISTLAGKLITLVVLVAVGWYIIRWVNRRIDALA